jgi:methylthioribose-1-phosphate isomerase
VIVDGAAGHLMQHGLVDLCITGTDRTTAAGDVCNKIGTYHVALAAADNGVPFYAAVPSTSIDWRMADGVAEIEIEQRGGEEISWVRGRARDGRMESVDILPDGSTAANFAFDVTPARLVTGLITERGVATATRAGLEALFPEVHDR